MTPGLFNQGHQSVDLPSSDNFAGSIDLRQLALDPLNQTSNERFPDLLVHIEAVRCYTDLTAVDELAEHQLIDRLIGSASASTIRRPNAPRQPLALL
ncbi:hypothetical protein D3C79_959390 [compost metagenome]